MGVGRANPTGIKESLWKMVVDELRNELEKSLVETWMLPLKIQVINDDSIVITAPNQFFADFVQANFADRIASAFKKLGVNKKLVFRADERELSAIQMRIKKANLNPELTFDNFIGGISNSYAKKWAEFVARRPDGYINPLFIYGATGLGKTHLLNAIGNYVLRKYPDKEVYYLTAEKFVEMVVASVRKKQIDRLRDFFKKIDLLLFDDFHELKGKPFMQREFLNVLKSMIESNKQLIISSRYSVDSMKWLNDGIRSRIRAGMVAYISSPDFDLKLHLIERIAEEFGLNLSPEQAEFLARHIGNDNRQIRGALVRISAFSSFLDRPISMNDITEVVSDLIQKKELFVDDVLKSVSKSFRIPISEIKGSTRRPSAVAARQASAILMRECLKMSLKEIGFHLNRSHSTIVYSIKRAKERLKNDKTFSRLFKKAKNILLK